MHAGRRSRRLGLRQSWGLLSLLVILALVLQACSTGPLSSAEGPVAVVGDSGFTVSLGDVTVQGDAGVAVKGTKVSIDDAPDALPAEVKGLETGAAFDIAFENGVQPDTPVMVSFRLPPNVNDSQSLFFITQRSDTGEWQGLPVTVNDGIVRVTMGHFSKGIFGWADDVVNGFLDKAKQFMKLGYSRPDCVGELASLGGAQYNVMADGEGVYPCVEVRDGRLSPYIQSATPFVWRYRPTPGDGIGLRGESPVELSGILTLALFDLMANYDYDKETVLVPGGKARVLLNQGVTSSTTGARVDPGLGLVAVLVAALDTAAAMTTGQDPTTWLDGALQSVEKENDVRAAVECMAGVVVEGMDVEANLGALGNVVLSCSASLLTKWAPSFLSGAVAVVVGIVTSLAGLLVTQVWGAIREVTKQNTVLIDVTPLIRGGGADVTGNWTGPINQPGVDPYSVNLSLEQVDGVWRGAVEYPELSCGGTWTLKSADGDSYVFTEEITYGTRCVPELDIAVQLLSDGRLSYGAMPPYTSTAVLARGTTAAAPSPSTTPASAGELGWPVEADDAPAGIRAWFGAASVAGEWSVGFPRWVSCLDDASVCIAGNDTTVGVVRRRTSGFYESDTLRTTQPARATLLDVGLTTAQIDELLAG